MKKIFLLLIMLFQFMIMQTAFGGSIFSKNDEEYVTDKTLPFFINIYSNNNDINSDFDDQQVVYTPQVHFYNKKLEQNIEQEEDNFFITAKRTKSVSMQKRESDEIELATNFIHGKWGLKSGISQEIISGSNQYYNYISFEPEYKLNDNVSIFAGVSHSITNNYDQTKLGFKLTPFNFKRIEFELSVSNYTKQFGSYRQKLNFGTNLKI